MLHKRAVITNAKFVYKQEDKHLLGKLKYFTYRNDRDDHIPQAGEDGENVRRWENRGLGENYKEIFENCQSLATDGLRQDISARTLVISPQMEMMSAIPADRRETVLKELTEATMSNWFERLDKPCPEYAFVLHKGEAKRERPEGIDRPDEAFLHTHVILAPTVEGREGREVYTVFKQDIEQLREAGAEEMERIWTRELGPERMKSLNQDLQDLTERLAAHDSKKESREKETEPDKRVSQRDEDEFSRDINKVLGIPNPPALEKRLDTYEAEKQLSPEKPQVAFDLNKELHSFSERLGLPLASPPQELDAELPVNSEPDIDFDL